MKKILSLLIVCFFVLSGLGAATGNFISNQEVYKIADVLVYNGAGAWDSGVVAFENFLDHKGMTWYECDDTYIENNDLIGNFGAIHFPGGDSGQYISVINNIGLQKIRDFVDAGGGYIGICAGGYFACDRVNWEGNTYDNPLDLFNGVGYGAIDEIAPWAGYAMTTINMNLANPINQYSPSTEYIMYYGGAAYYPDEGQEMNVIGTYDLFNDDAAIINYDYGNGRVLLIGPHPEIEEDSNRDNVFFADNLEDLGTDWNLLWTSIDWVIGWPISKPPDPVPPDIPEISGPPSGKPRTEYEYTFTTIDLDEEEIFFYIDWGDETYEDWFGPFASGEEVIIGHSWAERGTYLVQAKAKDVNGIEGNWGTIETSMPRSKIFSRSILDFLQQHSIVFQLFQRFLKL